MNTLFKTNIDKMGFRALFHMIMVRRWWLTFIIMLTFLVIIIGIGIAITNGTTIAEDWKEMLLLLLGAFIGNYGKIVDYWFSDVEKDKMFTQKMDEEDGTVLSKIENDNIKEENIVDNNNENLEEEKPKEE